MLSDTTAEMLLAIAESPGFSAATQSSTEVYTPGRSGHWEIVVNGNGTYTQTFKSPPLIETVLSDLDTYVAPIIDIASVLCLNPEFIAITGLSSAVATGVEVAATAINLTQAGQDFAAGDDLHGVLGVIEAVGGAFQEIGKAEGLSVGACSTTNGLQQFGEALSEGGAVAQGIDGVVAGAQSGNILAAITSGLGGVAGVAGLANASTIQQYAAVGEALGSTVQAANSGDGLAALDSLVQAAQSSGAIQAIPSVVQDVNAMVVAFELDVYDPMAAALTWLVQASSSELTSLVQEFENVTSVAEGNGDPNTQNYAAYAAMGADLASGDNANGNTILASFSTSSNYNSVDGMILGVESGLVSGQQENSSTPYVVNDQTPSDATLMSDPDFSFFPDASLFFLAPPNANFEAEYLSAQATAAAINNSNPLAWKAAAEAALGQGGTYDYQRDTSTRTFNSAYQEAANYSTGVWMAGAGFSETEMDVLCSGYLLDKSSDKSQILYDMSWWEKGWEDARNGNLASHPVVQ